MILVEYWETCSLRMNSRIIIQGRTLTLDILAIFFLLTKNTLCRKIKRLSDFVLHILRHFHVVR